MCRSLAEGGRRCPCTHSGYSSTRLASAARQRRSRAMRLLQTATDCGDADAARLAQQRLAEADGALTLIREQHNQADEHNPEPAKPRNVKSSSSKRRRANANAGGAAPDAEQPSTPPPTSGTSVTRVDKIIRGIVDEIAARPERPGREHRIAGRWVSMTELRAELDARGVSREAQDEHLRRMGRNRLLVVSPESNRKLVPDEDRANALRVGGEDNDIVSIWRGEDGGGWPVPRGRDIDAQGRQP